VAWLNYSRSQTILALCFKHTKCREARAMLMAPRSPGPGLFRSLTPPPAQNSFQTVLGTPLPARSATPPPAVVRQRSMTPTRGFREVGRASLVGPSNPPSFGVVRQHSHRSVTPIREHAAGGRNAVHRSVTPPRIRPCGPAPACRLLCYGDSNTAGFNPNSPVETPYADALAEGLTQAGLEVVMTSCGMNGKTAQELLMAAESPSVSDPFGRVGKGLAFLLREESPNLVVLMAGTNDLGSNVAPEAILPMIQRLQRLCLDHNAATIILGPPSVPSGPAAHARRQFVSLLSSWARSAPGVLACYDAEELVPRQPHLWAPDGFHFTPQGSAELGHRLVPLVLPLLQYGNAMMRPPGGQPLASMAAPPGSVPVPLAGSYAAPPPGAMPGIMPMVLPPVASGYMTPRGSITPRGVGSARGPAGDYVPFAMNVIDPARGSGPMQGPQGSPYAPLVDAHPDGAFTAFGNGDKVEVWSKTSQAWCPGRVSNVSENMVTAKIRLPDGKYGSKTLPLNHPGLRRR
jgi:lysophospholipase L1-like esterase